MSIEVRQQHLGSILIPHFYPGTLQSLGTSECVTEQDSGRNSAHIRIDQSFTNICSSFRHLEWARYLRV